MAKIAAYGKKIAGVKKTLKRMDDSGSVAGCARVAPTVIAVHRRGGWGRGSAMHTLNTYTILHPTPRIYEYNKEIPNSEITLLDRKSEIQNFNLYKIFWKRKRIYDFWNSRMSLPYLPVMKNK